MNKIHIVLVLLTRLERLLRSTRLEEELDLTHVLGYVNGGSVRDGLAPVCVDVMGDEYRLGLEGVVRGDVLVSSMLTESV